MKTGIMGGTFNPIHNGHLMLAKHVKEEFGLDEIWFMPNGNPPHKLQEEIRTDTKDRLNMVNLAIQEEPSFVLQPYEAKKETVSYSYQTMETFSRLYPERKFYFIIGADSLFQVETWGHPERFLTACTIIAAKRETNETDERMSEQIRYLNKKYNADIRFSHSPVFPVSSSEIRKLLQEGKTIRNLVPDSVLGYIRRNQLYKEAL